MNLYIVRHGQTNWNKKNFFQGRQDIDLNKNGIKQAKKIAKQMKHVHLDYIYSSPLKRAVHTANVINKFHKLDINISEQIIERNLGDLEGCLIDDYSSPNFWNTILNLNEPDKTFYNIEPLLSMIDRSNKFLENLLEKHTDDDVLIVCHGGIMLILLLLLGEVNPHSNLSEFKIDNCRCFCFSNPIIHQLDYKNNS